MVDGRGERLAVARDIHQPGLDRRRQCRCRPTHHEHEDEEADGSLPGECEARQRDREQPEADEERAHDAVVSTTAAEEVADRHSEPGGHENKWNEADIEARHSRGERGHVGVDGEKATEAERADQQGEPDLGPRERPQFALHRRTRIAELEWHHQHDRNERQGEYRGDSQVCDPPASLLPQERDRGNADDVGNRQARQHERHAATALTRPHEGGCHEGGDTEIGTVWKCRDEPGREHRFEARQKRGGDGAEHEDAEACQQQLLAREPGGERCNSRGTDHDPEGISRDQPAGLRVRQFVGLRPQAG